MFPLYYDVMFLLSLIYIMIIDKSSVLTHTGSLCPVLCRCLWTSTTQRRRSTRCPYRGNLASQRWASTLWVSYWPFLKYPTFGSSVLPSILSGYDGWSCFSLYLLGKDTASPKLREFCVKQWILKILNLFTYQIKLPNPIFVLSYKYMLLQLYLECHVEMRIGNLCCHSLMTF